MALKGLEKFKAFAEGLDSAPDRLEKLIDEALVELVPSLEAQRQEAFDGQRDPYGMPWPARKVSRPWATLNRTGELRRSITMQSKPGGTVDVGSTSSVAAAHQRGTRTLPKRQILPDDKRGLPRPWAKQLDRRIGEAVRLSLGVDRAATKK